MPKHSEAIQKPKNAFRTLFRLVSYYKGILPLFVLSLVAIVIYSVAVLGAAYYLKPIINILKDVGLAPNEQMGKVKALLIGMAIIYLISVLSNYLLNRLMLVVTKKALCQIRIEMFDRMQLLPINYFDTHNHGDIMSCYTNDIDAVREMLQHSITQLVISLVSLVGIVVLMLVLSLKLSALIVVMSVIVFLFIKRVSKKTKQYFSRQQMSVAKVNGYIEEMMTGQKVVKIFNHEAQTQMEFDKLNEELCVSSTGAGIYSNIVGPIMNNLSHIFYALTTTIGVLINTNGGVLITFLSYIRQFANRLMQISEEFTFIMRSLAGAERIFALLDEKEEQNDGKVTLVNVEIKEKELIETTEQTKRWAWKTKGNDGESALIPVKGDVRFNKVGFSYDGKKRILSDVTLYAKPGQKIAFVGSTGAGKTTITNLINRFYDIEEGEILFDGINVKDIEKSALRRSLAIVLQDTHLFSGTVADNIRYGKLDATDEEIEQAAKRANAHYFISNLPNGYKTELVADGANLSQGQRQLLAIARAAVAEPPVLILDEATSSIDTRTEKLIERGMDTLMEGRTVFVIAHRLSTVRNSNAIIVLENGQIIERGDHVDLLKQCGKYYKLYTGAFELS